MGSLEPERGERCDVVEILTTTGMVFLAMLAKEGGRLPSKARQIRGLGFAERQQSKPAQAI